MSNKSEERKTLRTDWKELPIDKENSQNVCKSKIIHYLCGVLHYEQRGRLAHIAGIFYARIYNRFRTPLQSVNAPAAVHNSVGQRVSAKPFFFAHTYCLTF